MDETYDPDDQFFQAFKAGFYAGCSDRQRARLEALDAELKARGELGLDKSFWSVYLGWLKS